MPPAGEAIAAAAADDVPLAADHIAGKKVGHIRADFDDLADELMPDDHRHGNRLLGPGVPFVDVQIGAADAGPIDADQHVVDADRRHGHFFEPQARAWPGVSQGLSSAASLNGPQSPRNKCESRNATSRLSDRGRVAGKVDRQADAHDLCLRRPSPGERSPGNGRGSPPRGEPSAAATTTTSRSPGTTAPRNRTSSSPPSPTTGQPKQIVLLREIAGNLGGRLAHHHARHQRHARHVAADPEIVVR